MEFLKLSLNGSIGNFMRLAEQIVEAGLADRVISERQLAALLGNGDARRYGRVNRALKDGSLIRLKRGTYLVGSRYRTDPIHPFAVAQALLPGSYISFETALAWHGWIPEAVYSNASVSPGRKTLVYETGALGQFTFHPLAICDYQFLVSVDRKKMGSRIAFVAQPLRALIDLVALRKERWSSLDWLTSGLRIEEAQLLSLGRKDFAALRPVYKHKPVQAFLQSLESAVFEIKAARRKLPNHD